MMTDSEILQIIDANPGIKALADAGNDAGCAFALVPLLPTVTVSRSITLKEIMTAFSTPEAGWSVIARVKAATSSPSAPPWLVSALAWLDPATANAGLDFGQPIVRQQIQALGAAGVLTAAEVATLLGLAEQPYPLKADDVSRIYAPRRAR
jgi:hypothetical protein